MGYKAGYDADENVLFIRDSASDNDVDYYQAPYSVDLEDGEWHTLTLRFRVDEFNSMLESEHGENDDGYYYVSLELDGDEVLAAGKYEEDGEVWGDIYGLSNLAPASDAKAYSIFRSFGLQADIDNLVQGNSEFRWTKLNYVLGDVNGDGKTNVVDLRILKANAAGSIEVDLNKKAADLDKSGDVTAADVLELAKLLAK